MDINRLSGRDQEIIRWIYDGLVSGRLKAEAETDANQHIVAVRIELRPSPKLEIDPRRTRPL